MSTFWGYALEQELDSLPEVKGHGALLHQQHTALASGRWHACTFGLSTRFEPSCVHVQDTAGALEFHNSYVLAQDTALIPSRDFTIMFWAKTPAWHPDLKEEFPFYQSMLTYATHAEALHSDSTPGEHSSG